MEEQNLWKIGLERSLIGRSVIKFNQMLWAGVFVKLW